MFTMRPSPLQACPASTAWQRSNVPLRLTARIIPLFGGDGEKASDGVLPGAGDHNGGTAKSFMDFGHARIDGWSVGDIDRHSDGGGS